RVPGDRLPAAALQRGAETMKQRYVVLRGPQGTRPRSRPARPRAGPAPAAQRPSGVLALAPSMPMRLIPPIGEARDVTATPAAATATWGIKAVKADTSSFTGAGIGAAGRDTGV